MLFLVGVGRVLDFAEQLGYTTFADRSRFGLSLVLGGGEVKLLEHANSYAAFANEGAQMPLASILKVEDASGNTLEEWTQPEGKQVMDRDTALRISNILSDNNARAYIFGAHNAFTLPNRPVAAKSGTTNNFHDAWTLGYTPQLAAGVWVGNNDNAEMKRGADGSQIAAPIWQGFMKRALASSTVETFPAPPPTDATKLVLWGKAFEVKIKIDKVSGKRATEFTPPELVEEQTFHEAHNILYYLDKDDPRGPAPTDPAQDPQYNNWESAVQVWVQKNNWNTTSTAPTEYDDVHTAASLPTVSILSPTQNALLTGRAFTVNVSASSPRRITHIDVTSEGQIIGTKQFDPWVIDVQFPSCFNKGFHDIRVTAYDDVGNKGTATVSLNLNAEAAPISLRVTNLADQSEISPSSFPVTVSVFASDISNAKKIDLYLQTPDGSTRLLGSEIGPTSNQLNFNWNFNPGPGNYVIFPVMTDKDDTTRVGDQTHVTIV